MIQLGVIQIRSLDGTIADIKDRLLTPANVVKEKGSLDHDFLMELFWLHCANSKRAFVKPLHFECGFSAKGMLRMFAVFTNGKRIGFDPIACLETLRQYCRSDEALTKED
jgi:hypothetical protein